MDLTTDLGIYIPESFGAVGDGTTDDSAAFQTMIANMPSQGGSVYLSNKVYKAPGLSINKTIAFIGKNEGDIQANNASTTIVTTATTGNMWTVAAHGVSFEKIKFLGSASATAGSAIRINAPSAGVQAKGFKITDCTFKYFWDQVDAYDVSGFSIDRCIFELPLNNGVNVSCVSLPDAGDSYIDGCLFDGGGYAAIYQTSSGGLRILNNKCNGAGALKFDYFYLGSLTGTSLLKICNNSIENYALRAIKLTGDNDMRALVFCNNDMAAYINTGVMVEIINVDDIIAVGNALLASGTATGFTFTDCNRIELFNSYAGFTNRYTQSGSTSIKDLNV